MADGAEPPTTPPVASSSSSGPASPDVAAFLDAAHRGDTAGALAVVRAAMAAGEGLVDVLERVVCGAQEQVGRLWERDEWSVAEEHLATAVAEEVVVEVAAGVRRNGGGGRGSLVAACVEGEWHSLALRVVAVACRTAGWDVEMLGPSVPVLHLARHVHDRGPDGLVLSCAVPANLVAARRTCEAVRGAGTPALVGGRAFGTDDRRAVAVGADAWAPRTRAIPDALATWTGQTTPAPPLDHPRLAEHVALESTVERLVAAGGPVDEVRALLRAVSAALLVDDRRVVDEQVAWALSAGGERRAVAAAALAAARAAVRPDLPVAAEWLTGTGS